MSSGPVVKIGWDWVFYPARGNVVIYFTLRRYLPDRKHALYNRDHVPLQIEIATLSRFAFARSPQSRAKMIVSSYSAARLCGESASGRVTKIAIDKRPRASENKGMSKAWGGVLPASGRLRDEEAAGSADPAPIRNEMPPAIAELIDHCGHSFPEKTNGHICFQDRNSSLSHDDLE